MRRICAFGLLAAMALLGQYACRSTNQAHTNTSPDDAGSKSGFAKGKPELAGFAWEEGDLATCYNGRSGAKVYVWTLQKNLTCDSTSSSWK